MGLSTSGNPQQTYVSATLAWVWLLGGDGDGG